MTGKSFFSLFLTLMLLSGGMTGLVLTPTQATSTPSASPPPAIFFTDVTSGPVTGGPGNLGAPIAIYGKGFGASRGSSRVTIGGVEVASYLVWGQGKAHNPYLDMIVVQPGPAVTGGPLVVTVNGQPSNTDHAFTVRNGAIYAIAPGGSDTNACSLVSPCLTVQHAAGEVMAPGDILLVRGGTYPEGEIWIRDNQAGLPGQPKAIKAYPGEQAYFTDASSGFTVDADDITVAGLNFRNGKSLDMAGWASLRQKEDAFIDNTFQGVIAWDAIGVEGDNQLVAGNVCQVSGSTVGTEGHCYYISQGANARILYNIASGAPGYGIHIYDEVRQNNDIQRIIRNVLVEGNLVENSSERSGLLIAMSDCSDYYQGGCRGNLIDGVTVRNNLFIGNNFVGVEVEGISQNIKVYNNTFYQNGQQGINIDNTANISGVDVRNNLIYQSANLNCTSNCSWFPLAHMQIGSLAKNVTLDTNGYSGGPLAILDENGDPIPARDNHAVTGAAGFAAPVAFDFHLLPGSVAIDHGVSLPDVPTDFDGIARPQGSAYDLGAFEYTPSYKPPSLMFLPFLKK